MKKCGSLQLQSPVRTSEVMCLISAVGLCLQEKLMCIDISTDTLH